MGNNNFDKTFTDIKITHMDTNMNLTEDDINVELSVMIFFIFKSEQNSNSNNKRMMHDIICECNHFIIIQKIVVLRKKL